MSLNSRLDTSEERISVLKDKDENNQRQNERN